MSDKIEKALLACEKVVEGIEDNTITTTAALLLCLKIARLTNDENSILWLKYEYGGYPRTKDDHIESNAFAIAWEHGRGDTKKGQKYIFVELASELEEKIHAEQKAVNNFTTQGASVGGDNAYIAMNNLTSAIAQNTGSYVVSIAECQKKLSKLKSTYYEYALKKLIELSFGNVATSVFDRYREQVDNYFAELSEETIIKLQAIEGKLSSGNPEMYSQALTTCRRLFECTADELFEKYCYDNEGELYKTKSGKEINVSGSHYKNKLSAVIETLEDKSADKTLIGSNIIYLLDWIDNLIALQCKGVHSNITKQDAERCVLQTYMCLGDVLNMQNQ